MTGTGYGLVLLDLDGTLADSAPGIVACAQHALREVGVPVPDDAAVRGVVGPPLADGFAALGVPAGIVEDAIAAYRAVYAAGGMFDNAVFDGVPEALVSLRECGARLAVATSKPEVYARRIVDHLGLDAHLDRGVDDVYGATLDGTRGTKGDVIAHALAGLRADGALAGLTPDQVVMVGDREHDVHGAAEHGIGCVGVAWGYAEPGELEAAGARAVVGSPAELVTAVLGLARRGSA
ncbi:HAD hydrolase-like protein [Cellulosimicrobium sp. PMB13]|uniref:HAD hydrolase-like protein n=1 Tax=Cellulosimicrobium sp. PMB13 TaxID=3120158 RepID=UPI003F4B348B